MPRLDDRLRAGAGSNRGCNRGLRRFGWRRGKLVHQPLPGFFGQLVEEPHSFGGVQPVDDGPHFRWRPGVQQDVCVVVGKVTDQRGREINRQQAEEYLLFLKGQCRQCPGRGARIERLDDRGGLVRPSLGENLAYSFEYRRRHSLSVKGATSNRR